PSYARRGAALDLVQQTGARAVLEHRVLAGTQAEDLLQQVDALPRRTAVRERPEVARAARERAAVVGQAREIVGRQADVRVALVVAEQDVVAWRKLLDEVVLEDQRLGLGARRRDVHAPDLRHHHRDARARLR